MKIIRDFGEYFKYSLHDAHINRVEHKQEKLVLFFNYIFRILKIQSKPIKQRLFLSIQILMTSVYLCSTKDG